MSKSNLLPLLIDLSNKKIVIFGAGKVAERKARLFLDYANVTVVNNHFSSTLSQLKDKAGAGQLQSGAGQLQSGAGQLRFIAADLGHLTDEQLSDILSDAFLVIPATAEPLLNAQLAQRAKDCGALVNTVDNRGEVVVPSIVTQGDILIGISTKGTSPALSKYMRNKIEHIITPKYAAMARLQDEMREYYKQHIDSQDERKQKLWQLLNNDAIWVALTEDYDKALKLAHSL